MGMQYDMHYYGTYAMAAAAGIPKNDAEIIAYAAQYVDDQNQMTLNSAKQVAGAIHEAVVGIATARDGNLHQLSTARSLGLQSSMGRTAGQDQTNTN